MEFILSEPTERDLIRAKMDAEIDWRTQIHAAERRGMAIGNARAEAAEARAAQAIEAAEASAAQAVEAAEARVLATAKKMKGDGLSLEKISEYTGLSLEELATI